MIYSLTPNGHPKQTLRFVTFHSLIQKQMRSCLILRRIRGFNDNCSAQVGLSHVSKFIMAVFISQYICDLSIMMKIEFTFLLCITQNININIITVKVPTVFILRELWTYDTPNSLIRYCQNSTCCLFYFQLRGLKERNSSLIAKAVTGN